MPLRPRLFLIDGNSQMYRAYHAIRGLTGPDGRSTNAVYGFITMLRKLIGEEQPDLMAAAFDLKGPTFRHDLSPDYKANRHPMPDDLVEQISWVHEACVALGVPIVTHEGFEADDVIDTLATRAAADGFEVVVVSGDKDFFQLVGRQIRVFNPRDEGTWYDAAGVVKKFGVDPGQVVDVLALMGDVSDNVKGVPGIGAKGARELLTNFGSLDWLLEHADELPKKKYRTALTKYVDDALKSRELVRIHTDVPVTYQPERYRYQGADRERCFTLFSELGFKSLLGDFAPNANSVATDYRIIGDITGLKELAASLRVAGRFGLHVLTVSGAPNRNGIVGLTFSTAKRSARYVPLAWGELDLTAGLDSRTVLETLGPILGDPQVRKVGHDLKREMLWLAACEVHLIGLEFDTMIASSQPIKVTINAQGVTIPSRQVALKSEVTGRVIWSSHKLRPGGMFRAGEAILKLDPRDYEIAVAQQKAALGRAQVDLQIERGRKNVAEREWALMKKKAKGSPLALREPQLASAQLALEAAESGLRRADLNLDRTTIRAPFDAFVSQKNVDVGELVTIQSPLGSIASSDSFWVEVKVPARKLPWVSFPKDGQPGSKARISLNFGGQQITRRARVIQLAGDLDPVGKMARVIVEIDDPFALSSNPNSLPLLLGSFVTVNIASQRELRAVSIPRTALLALRPQQIPQTGRA